MYLQSLIFCLLVLSITKRVVLKSLTLIVDLPFFFVLLIFISRISKLPVGRVVEDSGWAEDSRKGGSRYAGEKKGEVGSRKWVLTFGGRTPKQCIQFSTGPRMVFGFRDFWKVKTLASARVASLLHSG